MRMHPDLEQLKRQAKELQRAFRSDEAAAVSEVNAHYRAADPASFALHEAQLVLARSYGFDSWAKLTAYVDGVTVRRLADAIAAGDLAQVRSMLRARPELANLTMSYGDEHRPIHFAVIHRSPEILRLLLRHGADARAGIHPHRSATTAWAMAQDRGYADLLAVIEEEETKAQGAAKPDAVELVGDESARNAVATGNGDWLRERHAAGALTNHVRWNGGGLLTVAVQHGQFEILQFLLDVGFHPDERVSIGDGDWVAWSQGYPLWEAAALGRIEMAELLLQRGANPNVHVDSSGSSVYSAYSHRQWGMVDLLRRHGGVVTADTAALYRQTDLAQQMLVGEPGEAVVHELLNFGASGGAPEIVKMALAQTTLPPDDPRWFRWLTEPLSFWHHIPWLYAGNREFDRRTYLTCFRLILQRCGPNVIGGFGRTPLHEVAAMGAHVTDDEVTGFAEVLLQAGAATTQRDDLLKSTPLGWASRWGRVGMVRSLMAHGADPAEADAEPWARPAAWAERQGHSAVLGVLKS